MTIDELTAEVKALEYRLLEVWNWEVLGQIGWNMNLAQLDHMPGETYIADAIRDLELEAETHLVKCYTLAIEDVEHTLKILPQGPNCTALLERLQDSLRQVAKSSYHLYLDSIANSRDLEASDDTGSLSNEEISRLTDEYHHLRRDGWGCIEDSLGNYLSRVADFIGTMTSSERNKLTSGRTQPKWIGTASELAFLLTELVDAGYLVPPPIGKKSGKDGNRAAIADAVLNAFDVRKDNGEGDPVTPTYFRSLMRPDSPDRGTFPKLFTIRPRTASK